MNTGRVVRLTSWRANLNAEMPLRLGIRKDCRHDMMCAIAMFLLLVCVVFHAVGLGRDSNRLKRSTRHA